MGTTSINTFEGQSDGVPVSAVNSAASGIPYGALNFPTNTSMTYKAAAAIRGGIGVEIGRTAATACYATRTLTARDRYSKLFGVRFPTLPVDYVVLHAYRNATQQSAAIAINSTFHPYVCAGGAGTPNTLVAGSALTAALAAGTARYLGYDIDAVAGTWWIGLYDTSGGLLEEKFGSGGSFGAAQITNDRIGILSAGTNVALVWHLDDDQQEDAPTVHPVPPGSAPALVVRPNAIVSNAGSSWTNVGGAASLNAALADELDTTYIRSADNPTGQEIVIGFPTLDTGPITLPVRHRASSLAAPISRVYKVYQTTTGTLVATRTVNPLPTSWEDYEIELTTGEEALVTNRALIKLGVADTAV